MLQVFFWCDKNVPELDDGDGCTADFRSPWGVHFQVHCMVCELQLNKAVTKT